MSVPTLDPVEVHRREPFLLFVLDSPDRNRPKGDRVPSLRTDISEERATLTLITSLHEIQHPCWASVTHGSNDASNFAHTVMDAVRDGYFVAGDVIILDNAKVCLVIFAIIDNHRILIRSFL